MSRVKKIITVIVLSVLTLTSTNFAQAEEANDRETEANVSLKKGENSEKEIVKKNPIYTTAKPKEIRLLPQTGEILASFMYAMIGLSLLIFIIGLFFNKYSINNMEWSY